MFDVTNLHVLITGTTSGFGEHFARLLAGKGARVTLTGRRVERLNELCKELRKSGAQVQAVSLDVQDQTSVTDCFKQASAGFGCPDVVINNAGITAQGRAENITTEEWDGVMNTNLRGAWFVAQAAAKQMIVRDEGGSIINIASILGHRVAGGVAPYSISKAGLVQMTKQLALEWARHGIRVNSISPGYFSTELNQEFFNSDPGAALIKRVPLRRLGRAEDIDGALLLLASNASAFMTGSIIAVDGGHLVSGL